jgi:hypothetical protein
VTEPGPDPRRRLTILRLLALAAVIGISVFIFSIRDRAEEIAGYGYPGIFFLSLLANATLILPAPGWAVTFAMGAVFNPLGVGLAAASGATLGELTGYMAGFSGQAVMENARVYEKLLAGRRCGGLTIIAWLPSQTRSSIWLGSRRRRACRRAVPALYLDRQDDQDGLACLRRCGVDRLAEALARQDRGER